MRLKCWYQKAQILIGVICVMGCFGCSSNSSRAPSMPVAQKISISTVPLASNPVSCVRDSESDDLGYEFSRLLIDADQLQTKVQSLRDSIDEIVAHRGDIHEAESTSDEIIAETQALLDRVQSLRSSAEQAENEEIAEKCLVLEASLGNLHTSVSELHDNIELAESDSIFRHHDGVDAMSDGMDDVETNAVEVTSDAQD